MTNYGFIVWVIMFFLAKIVICLAFIILTLKLVITYDNFAFLWLLIIPTLNALYLPSVRKDINNESRNS